LKILKNIFKALIPDPLKRKIYPLLLKEKIRRSWINRKVDQNLDHLSLYWNDDEAPNRLQLIDLLKLLKLKIDSKTLHILEYGSHCGVNIKLLRKEMTGKNYNFYAVEPNVEAYDFLIKNLPEVVALNGDDQQFIQSEFPKRNVDISFVNSVFFSMEPSRAKSVFMRLLEISDILVVGDGLDNCYGNNSQFILKFNCYHHPFGSWLKGTGFKYSNIVIAHKAVPQLNGFLIATKLGNIL